MARTAKPLTELLNGVSAVISSLQSQENVAYTNTETQKADVKVLDQLARAIRKLPVAETVSRERLVGRVDDKELNRRFGPS